MKTALLISLLFVTPITEATNDPPATLTPYEIELQMIQRKLEHTTNLQELVSMRTNLKTQISDMMVQQWQASGSNMIPAGDFKRFTVNVDPSLSNEFTRMRLELLVIEDTLRRVKEATNGN